MLTKEEIHRQRDQNPVAGHRHGATHVRLFGSVARGDATECSDVDFIVRFEPNRSLFDHAGLIDDLEDLLGVKVDVVSEAGMRERFREAVANQMVPP